MYFSNLKPTLRLQITRQQPALLNLSAAKRLYDDFFFTITSDRLHEIELRRTRPMQLRKIDSKISVLLSGLQNVQNARNYELRDECKHGKPKNRFLLRQKILRKAWLVLYRGWNGYNVVSLY